ncbi:MAG TPA: DUF3048 domain-containing protein [Acidimicrobiales bacterium]|nr:DUF3048 domain-containing protein [Acidimicrobiales bacterium]
MNRRTVIAAVATAVVLLGGVVAVVLLSGRGEEQAAPTTTSTTEAPTTTTAPPVFPLTGLPLGDATVAGRPALVVKVDNSTKARERLAGVGAADVVYVEGVEGGVTRLAAVFHSTDSDVGPVRSARTTDIDLTANLNRPLFAYSGANEGVLERVRGANLVDLGFDARPGDYQVRGSGVLRFFIGTAAFFGFAPPDAGPPPALFAYRREGEAVSAAGAEDTPGVSIAYGGEANTQVRYEVVPEGWNRVQDGSAYVDAGGAQVVPANVIVQFSEYRDSGFVDVVGSPSPEAVTVGEGEAWVLTGGKIVRGRWSRPDPGAATTYTDGAGAPIALTPGRTWIELAPIGSATPL